LPGPLIKWFLKTLGNEGIYNLVKEKDKSAVAKSLIGFTDGKKQWFFQGITKGEIVKPVKGGYGWDPIFKPEKSNKTFSQMPDEVRSMRKQAFLKFKKFLDIKWKQ
jgi:non-canonical purine NTP pyrophosphatase (RdgB/HAM1 family)